MVIKKHRGKGDLLSSYVLYNELFAQQISTGNLKCYDH